MERLRLIPPLQQPRGFSLSIKLLLLTSLFVMLAEVLIYIPSVINYRSSWIDERIVEAKIIATMHKKLASQNAADMFSRENFEPFVEIKSLTLKKQDVSQNIITTDETFRVDAIFMESHSSGFDKITQAFGTLFYNGQRHISLLRDAEKICTGCKIELVIDEGTLFGDIIDYSANIFWLSLVISIMTAGLVFFTISLLFVRPTKQINSNMRAFTENPQDARHIIKPSKRGDEIGEMEERLANLETQVFTLLQEQKHFADIGMAVTKIYHDLKNILTSAQLLSDQVATFDDPKAQKYAPLLVNTLDRAINFCQHTLDYVRARSKPPRFERVCLRNLVDDTADTLGLYEHPGINFENQVGRGNKIMVDDTQFPRVFMNIFRNSIDALEALDKQEDVKRNEANWIKVQARKSPVNIFIEIADNGPGIPEMAQKSLFDAFHGSFNPQGSGLGLAICHEIVTAHGGDIKHVKEAPGTVFEISLPLPQ